MGNIKNLCGQLTLWDIEIINQIATEENEKPSIPLGITEKQQIFLDDNNIMENENLSRTIKYSGGGLGIEFNTEEGFQTVYVNRDGEKEFTKDKRLSVLPMDKILYYRKELEINNLQEDKLQELKLKYKESNIIKRKGDENILVEVPGKVISINTLGWVLEFNEIQAVYEENEIIKDNVAEDLQYIQDYVKPGDFVQAMYGKEVIEGKIIREYGLGNEILNIVFDNKHTAIGRRHVIKILKAS